jgi:hypothetical protein
MHDRFLSSALAVLTASALLAGCSGGGGGSSPVRTPATQAPSQNNPQAQSEMAVSDANALGSPLQDFSDFDKTIASSSIGDATATRTHSVTTGTCTNGVEFFAPDRNGDPGSTETIDFYDAACTEQARDLVRVFTSTGASSENVAMTESLYAIGNATPIATRSEMRTITNATFNSNGFPIAADGFDLVESGSLNISGAKTISSSRELVLSAASSGTTNYCSDSAGYNATGIAKLSETFGWQGGILTGGSRTINADNSVTWTGTNAGTAFNGAIGSLAIASGAQNTTCPISTPMFTLTGGTSTGSYSIPVTATYANGRLESLTIAGATLANGTTLNVTTNASVGPSSTQFITGSVSSGATQIATFAVDGFGDGTLTVTGTGAQYVITAWHVVR